MKEQRIESFELGSPLSIMGGEESTPQVLDLDNTPPVEVIVEKEEPVVELEPISQVEPEVDPLIEPKEEPKANEEPVPEEDLEYDIKVKANLTKYAAEALKAKGGLPEDFVITDEITESEVDAAYVAYKEEPFRNQIRREELQRIQEEEGLTPEMIKDVKRRHYGVQDPELQQLQMLDYLSNYSFDSKSDTFGEEAKEFLTRYYDIKKINKITSEGLVESNLVNDNLETILIEAQKDLQNEYINLDSVISDRVKAEQELRSREKQKRKETIQNILKSNIVNNVKYTEDEMEKVRKALFDKTEIIEGPDGQKYRATLYYKKRMEALSNPEKDLEDKILFILGGNREIREEEREKAASNIMGKLNDFIDVKIKKPKKTQPKEPVQSTPVQGIQMRELG